MNVDLKKLICNSSKLYVLPSVYAEFNKMLEQPNTTNLQLANIIQYDAGLASFLLKVVNSAFYGFSSHIDDIAHAMSIIGRKELATLVLGKSVVNAFSRSAINEQTLNAHWEQSLYDALFAKNIAAVAGCKPHSSETLFVCGLISGIGKLVIWHERPELAIEYCNADTELAYRRVERKLIGFNYNEVGANLIKRWRLPEVFIQTCFFNWKAKTKYPDNAIPIISLAKALAFYQLKKTNNEGEDPLILALFQYINMDEESMTRLLNEAELQIKGLKTHFLS